MLSAVSILKSLTCKYTTEIPDNDNTYNTLFFVTLMNTDIFGFSFSGMW